VHLAAGDDEIVDTDSPQRTTELQQQLRNTRCCLTLAHIEDYNDGNLLNTEREFIRKIAYTVGDATDRAIEQVRSAATHAAERRGDTLEGAGEAAERTREVTGTFTFGPMCCGVIPTALSNTSSSCDARTCSLWCFAICSAHHSVFAFANSAVTTACGDRRRSSRKYERYFSRDTS
jgi:hypothetical protein